MNEVLDIQIERNGPIAIVRVAGDVDLYTSPQLRKVLLDLAGETTRYLILDLEKVTYMDSSGLASLVEGLQRMEKYGGRLLLCSLQEMVQNVFELSRLDTVFPIFEDLETAQSSLSASDE
jgi:anti-sigma B factor antagonist